MAKPLKSRARSKGANSHPGKSNRVTLRQVAAVAGVSDATVSLALRSHPRIPQETCRRIREIARRLGYQADPAVQRLMTYLRTRRYPLRDGSVAFVSAFEHPRPWRDNLHLARIRQGMENRAARLGFKLDDFWLGEAGMTPRRLGEILRTRGMNGVVFLGFPHATPALDFPWEHFAATTIGHSLGGPLHRVCQHHYAELTRAVTELHRLGYRRPGLVLNTDVDDRVQRYYRAAFLVADLAEALLPPFLWPLEADSGRSLDRLLAWRRRHQPDVLLMSQPPPDVREVAAKLAATKRAAPPAVALLDLHDRDIGAYAGMRHAYEDLGSAALDVVVGQIMRGEKGLPTHPRVVMIGGEWHDGASAPAKQARGVLSGGSGPGR